MRVRMLALSAGPGGVFQPGTVRDLPDGEAYELIEGRYAEQVDFAPPAAATETDPAESGADASPPAAPAPPAASAKSKRK